MYETKKTEMVMFVMQWNGKNTGGLIVRRSEYTRVMVADVCLHFIVASLATSNALIIIFAASGLDNEMTTAELVDTLCSIY